MEPNEVRLARLEEGLVGLHSKLDSNHKAVMDLLKPIPEKVARHDTDIALVKRDRWWVSSIVGVAASWIGLKLFGKG